MNSSDAPPQLQDMKILLTRPEPQSAELIVSLKLAGAETGSLAALAISPLSETAELRQSFMNIDHFDTVIFISPNAACIGGQYIDQYWPQLPEKICWLAVGLTTATTLASYGIIASTPEVMADSDGLLALPVLQACAGQKILIVRGQGGRERLADTLSERGATVTYAEVYQRTCPDYSTATVISKVQNFAPDCIIVYSGETLKNLITISNKAGVFVKNRLILVPGERVAEQARQLQFNDVIVPESLREPDIICCLGARWRANKPHTP